MAPGPLWILSWDGAAPWLLDRARAEGALPNLERLRARGASAAGSMADHPDVTTPPGHALLWTGHPASANGITSFKIPAQPPEEHDLTEAVSGFDARLFLKEPIWVTAARAGRTSTLVHTPLSGPVDVWTDPERFGPEVAERVKVFHGYGPMRYPVGLVEAPKLRRPQDWKDLDFSLEGAREFQYRSRPLSVPVLVLANEKGRFERLYVAADKRPGSPGVFVDVGPDAGFSEPLRLPDGTVRFRCFRLDSLTGTVELFSTCAFDVECLPADDAAGYAEALGSFPGGGAYRLYGEGKFGPTMKDGAAEARYMETHDAGMQHFEASSVWACEHHPADLMIFYNPGIDEAQHIWAGYVEEGRPCHDPAKAELAWPLLRTAYQRADRHLGALLDKLPEDGTLMLVSDHGITGIHRHFLPNVVLKKAGLLKLKKSNRHQVDLARTKAIYHPANNSYVFLNTKQFKNGCVEEEEREELLEKVREVLMAEQDPDTGEPVLAHVVRVDTLPEDSDMRGQGRGDLFLALKPGYSLGESFHQRALLPAFLAGHHQQHPGLRSNHAVFDLCGPGVRAGHEFGVVSHRDVHETMRRVLGLEAGDGGGVVVTQAFEGDADEAPAARKGAGAGG